MRKILLILAVLALMGLAGTAYALPKPISYPPAPSWYDDTAQNGSHPGTPDFVKSGTLTYENATGGNDDSGTLDIAMDNLYRPNYTKEVYLVLEWWVTGEDGGGVLPAQLYDPVMIYWPSHLTPVAMTKTQGPVDQLGKTHLEYAYTIPEQPEIEWFQFAYSGIDEGQMINIDFVVETKCFENPVAEPGSLMLVGLGLVGFVARKRRS